jgi:hypothetical protein
MDLNSSTTIPSFKIETIKVEAKVRRLNATWTLEMPWSAADYAASLNIIRADDGRLERAVYSVGKSLDGYKDKIDEFKRWCDDRGLIYVVLNVDLLKPVEIVIDDLDEDDVTELLLRWQ